MHTAELSEITAREVLILDTNAFVAEIGLMSGEGSALKHYLYRREMQLVVPEVVAEECERHLTKRAQEKRKKIECGLQWLSRFFGEIGGWQRPNDETITERATALARAEHLGAVVIPETRDIQRRAKLRDESKRPPAHNKSGLADCIIWEQCLDLLARCRIVFVSDDGDFCRDNKSDELHPALRAEANKVAKDRSLTFHRKVGSFLSELRSDIQPIPDNVVFSFVYESIASEIEGLESNSGCHPKRIGEIKQTLLTTEKTEVIEVRLEIADIWESADKAKTMDFHLSGSCRYRLADDKLCDLTTSTLRLSGEQPDGSVRSVKGSYVKIRAHAYFGAPPIHPKPVELETNDECQ